MDFQILWVKILVKNICKNLSDKCSASMLAMHQNLFHLPKKSGAKD